MTTLMMYCVYVYVCVYMCVCVCVYERMDSGSYLMELSALVEMSKASAPFPHVLRSIVKHPHTHTPPL